MKKTKLQLLITTCFLLITGCLVNTKDILAYTKDQNVKSYISKVSIEGHYKVNASTPSYFSIYVNTSFPEFGNENQNKTFSTGSKEFQCQNPGKSYPTSVSSYTAKITKVTDCNATVYLYITTKGGSDTQNIAGDFTIPQIYNATFDGTTALASGQSSFVEISSSSYTANFTHTRKRTDSNPKTAKSTASIWHSTDGGNTFSQTDYYNTWWSTTKGGSTNITKGITYSGIQLGTKVKVCAKIRSTRQTVKYSCDNPAISSSGSFESTPSCVTIGRPYNFSIQDLSINMAGSPVYAGESTSYSTNNYSVSTAAGHSNMAKTDTPNIAKKVISFVLPKTTSQSRINTGTITGTYGSNLCGYANSLGAKFCNDTTSSTSLSVPDLDSVELGDKLCVMYGTNYDRNGFYGYQEQLSESWQYSNIACRTIAKKPSAQIFGSLFTTGDIRSSLAKGQYSSKAQFMVIANGTIVNFASGLAKANGTDYCQMSPLTISSTQCSSKKLGEAKVTPNASKNFRDRIVSHLDSLTNAEVRKTNQITTNLSGTADRPLIIYSSDDITIDQSVTNLDHVWLIADGTINTCNYNQPDIQYGQCTNSLNINGVVYAKKINPKRTYGAGGGNDSGTPAETFTLDPAAIEWAYRQAAIDKIKASTVFTKELAPRL